MASIRPREGAWQAKVRRKGYPTQSATFKTKAAAERWARDIEGKVDKGTLSPTDGEARRITLTEALDRYETEVTAKKKEPSANGSASRLGAGMRWRRVCWVRSDRMTSPRRATQCRRLDWGPMPCA